MRHTHVLALASTHDAALAGYNATRRNEVRRAAKEGVTVRRTEDLASLTAYYRIHTALWYDKGRPLDYPIEVFRDLLSLREAHLFVAEHAGAVIAGGLFFRDGDSLMYWHGAANRGPMRDGSRPVPFSIMRSGSRSRTDARTSTLAPRAASRLSRRSS